MLMPKRTKFRKKMRDRMKRSATTGNTVSFGSVALQATDRGYVSNRQIEAARRVITRTLKRDGKTWIRIFPDKPITSKPAEVRMGKGKGAVDSWVAVVRPGRIMYEIDGVSEEVATEALRLAAYKLPVKSRIIKRAAVI
ncbi:MAG TPA: 50S ribosomal protein L16 [Deltaproteobacteria bacterium]|nr:50S ribosomal protein L16 [Deltaproteobacteria bacterium]